MSWRLAVTNPYNICINCGLSDSPLIFSWLYFIWYSIVSVFLCPDLLMRSAWQSCYPLRSFCLWFTFLPPGAQSTRVINDGQSHARTDFPLSLSCYSVFQSRRHNIIKYTTAVLPSLPIPKLLYYFLAYFETLFPVRRLHRVKWQDGERRSKLKP